MMMTGKRVVLNGGDNNIQSQPLDILRAWIGLGVDYGRGHGSGEEGVFGPSHTHWPS